MLAAISLGSKISSINPFSNASLAVSHVSASNNSFSSSSLILSALSKYA